MMLRQISRIRVGVICASVWVAIPALAQSRIIPGMSTRTNSPECLAKYQEVHGLAASYFNGIPAVSTLRRVDVLAGGLAMSNATLAPGTGKQTTQLYAMSSSYGSVPTGNFDGFMELRNSEDRFEVGTYSNVRIKLSDGGMLTLTASHNSCGAAEKSADIKINYLNKANVSQFGAFTFRLNLGFGSSLSETRCGSPSKTMADFLTDLKANLPTAPDIMGPNYSNVPYTAYDTEAERNDLALNWANANYMGYYIQSGSRSYQVTHLSCSFEYDDADLAPFESDWSSVETRRKGNLYKLNVAARLAQCNVEMGIFVDRMLASGILKSTAFATGCAKAK